MTRPRAAFFSFGSCEGCQLQVLSVEDLLLHEADAVKGLASAGLIFENNGSYYLSQLGAQTAQGAAKIWAAESSQSLDQAISTARVALNLINQEIRKLKTQVPK